MKPRSFSSIGKFCLRNWIDARSHTKVVRIHRKEPQSKRTSFPRKTGSLSVVFRSLSVEVSDYLFDSKVGADRYIARDDICKCVISNCVDLHLWNDNCGIRSSPLGSDTKFCRAGHDGSGQGNCEITQETNQRKYFRFDSSHGRFLGNNFGRYYL